MNTASPRDVRAAVAGFAQNTRAVSSDIAPKPIPTEIEDINRSLDQLANELGTLSGKLEPVMEAPSPACEEPMKDPARPPGVLTDLFAIHKKVRLAIAWTESLRQRLQI